MALSVKMSQTLTLSCIDRIEPLEEATVLIPSVKMSKRTADDNIATNGIQHSAICVQLQQRIGSRPTSQIC